MKRLILALLLLAPSAAFAVPTCGHYMPSGCSLYGPGLEEMLETTPLQYDDGDAWFAGGFDEDELDTLGVFDAISYDGSTPDVAVASGPNPWTVKAIQEFHEDFAEHTHTTLADPEPAVANMSNATGILFLTDATTAINADRAKINAILAALREKGIIEP